MTEFYPSVVVNLKLRFDESLTIVANQAAPVSVDQATGQAQIPGAPTLEPLIFQRGVDNASFLLNRVPKKCNVELPGYRQAATFSIDLDYKDLPIDPRTVRAAAVEIHAGTVTPENFSRGIQGPDQFGYRSSILRTRAADGSVNQDTLLMVGMVDEWSTDNDDKGSTVTLKGRDMRGILLDTPIGLDPANVEAYFNDIDTALPIDEVVSKILFLHPAFSDIRVIVNPAEWPGGDVPEPWSKDITPRHRKGATGKRAAPRSPPPSEIGKINFWDLIVRLCYLVGAIPYFKGTDLLIRPTRSIFDQANAGTALNPTPFAGGRPRAVDAPTGDGIDPALRYRRLMYGRDLRSLSFDRKYGGYQRPHVIRVVCVDGDSDKRGQDRLLEATWPPDAMKPGSKTKTATKVGPGGSGNEQEVLNIPITGLKDPKRMQDIAQSVYEEIGRGEMGGSASTPNMASFGGTNADPDMIRLRPGDGVEFVVGTAQMTPTGPLVSTLTDSFRQSFAKAVADVRQRIGDENLSRVLVATTRGVIQQLPRFFRVSTVKFDWSDKGLKIDFDFQNYVVSRNQFNDNQTRGQSAPYQPGRAQSTSVPKRAGGLG